MHTRIRHIVLASIGLASSLVVLLACDVGSVITVVGTDVALTATAAAREPVWRFPFAKGTTMTIGEKGLHGDNYPYVPVCATLDPAAAKGYTQCALPGATGATQGADATGTQYTFDNPTFDQASLDLLSTSPIEALADGTVLARWDRCHVVLIDHGNGWWVIYLHLQNITVVPGDQTTSGEIIGTPAPDAAANPDCKEQIQGQHVHFAFLRPTSGGTVANAASYVSMDNRTLCGYYVDGLSKQMTLKSADGSEVYGINQSITVPDCPTTPPSGTPIA